MKTEKISVQKICMIAFAICINFVGGQIALFLKLPIYLDSIGTVFVAAVLGPFYGMLPNLLSGLLMGMTVDIYSLYYAPVGILLGFVTGLVYRKFQPKKWQIFPAALVITLSSGKILLHTFTQRCNKNCCYCNTQNPVNVICDKLNHKAASYHSKRCFCQKLYKNGGSGRSDSSK